MVSRDERATGPGPGAADYAFGPFRLDAKKRVLWRADELLPLAPKALDLLVALVENQGDVVTKDDLMSRVWPDTFVEEANLSVNVSALRKALGEQEDGRPYIQTVPRRGYRFLAAGPARAKDTRPVLAVLPFRALGPDGDATLGLALADAVIARLSGGAGLLVRPTSAVMKYVEAPQEAPLAARELGADAVLEGTLLRDAARLRVTVQLVPARSAEGGRPAALAAWSDRLDLAFTDVFAAQDAVAERVATALARHLGASGTPPERRATQDPAAYEAYLKGRHFWSRFTGPTLQRAYECFQEAAERDPSYAGPHAGLADVFLVLGFTGIVAPKDAWPMARAAAAAALALDERVAEAHVSLAFVLLFEEWDWEAAGRELRRAVELDPDGAGPRQWHALYLLLVGRLDEAAVEQRRAQELDPLSLIVSVMQGFRRALEHDFEAELEQQTRTLELDPHQFLGHWGLGLAHLHLGRGGEAIACHRRALELTEGGTLMKAVLAFTLATAGRADEARALLQELEAAARDGPVSSYLRATGHAALQERETALRCLEAACEARDPWLVLSGVDPMLDSLRGEPRFQDLLARVGLA